jgi:hypothetical protein
VPVTQLVGLFVVLDGHGERGNVRSGEVMGGHRLVEDDDVASLRGDAQLGGRRSVIGAAGEPDSGDRVFLNGARLLEQHLAGRGEGEVAVAAYEQWGTDDRFQAPDRPGQRGLGHPQPLGGPGEIPLLRDSDEVAKLPQVDLCHAGSRPDPVDCGK